jgi:hypothetical protein
VHILKNVPVAAAAEGERWDGVIKATDTKADYRNAIPLAAVTSADLMLQRAGSDVFVDFKARPLVEMAQLCVASLGADL